MRTMIALVFCVSLAACGGGGGGDFPPESGVDPSLMVSALDAGELATLCEWSIDALGGAGHMESCGDGVNFTTQTQASCVASFSGVTCSATVGEIEDCINATGGDGCKVLTEEACSVLFECAG